MMQVAVNINDLYVMPSLYPKLLSPSFVTTQKETERHIGKDMLTHVRTNAFFGLSERIKEIRYIPLPKSVIDYESNVWDFSQYTMTSSSHTKLYFENVPENFRDEMKFFTIAQIMSGNSKFQTVYSRFQNLNKFFKHLENRKINTINSIIYDDVKTFFDNLQCNEHAKAHYKAHLRLFMDIYSSEYGVPIYTKDIQELCNAEIKPMELYRR